MYKLNVRFMNFGKGETKKLKLFLIGVRFYMN